MKKFTIGRVIGPKNTCFLEYYMLILIQLEVNIILISNLFAAGMV